MAMIIFDPGSYWHNAQNVEDINASHMRHLEKVREEGIKHDSEKLPEHLYSIDAHNRLLEILKHGAAKYGENNWRKGMAWSRVYGAALRHLHAWWNGENIDPETKKSHLAHAFTNLMFLNHYEHNKVGTDDRPTSDEPRRGRIR